MGKIAGIDLGTTFSAISILNDLGKPQIVPSADGERIMASALYFSDTGTVHVGREAIQSRCEDVSRSVRWIKKHMVDADYRRTIDGKEYTPADLSALILKKLHQDAIPQIGEITDVVISIPAHFGEVARKATMDAGKIAGLNVVGIVNEPTAAALYYALEHQVSGRVMIFDLGGGTFDVTIADVAGQDVKIIASQGTHIGGYDFDQKLVGDLAEKFKQETGGALFCSEEDRSDIEDIAEETKKSLSKKETVPFKLRGDDGTSKGEIQRGEFESLISAEIAQIEMLIETVLDESKCEPKGIEKVLLAGGSSRIPAMQNLLKRIFGYEPTQVGNLDECVSLGAALHCGIITGKLKTVELTDVCNHSYGTLCRVFDEVTQKEGLENIFIIPKNTPIPCDITNDLYTIADGQERLNARVTQGESSDPDAVTIIAQGDLPLPSGRPSGCPIDIKYSYDANQRMTCTFTDRESGNTKEFDIDPKSGTASERIIERKKVELANLVIE